MKDEQKNTLIDATKMMCPYCAQDFPFKEPWYHTGFPDKVMRMCEAHDIHQLIIGKFQMPRNLKRTKETGLLALSIFEKYHKDVNGVPAAIMNDKLDVQGEKK
jgi:hypothetical protein